MADLKIRHLVAKRGSRGGVRHYWQPSGELRAAGWQPERLPDEQGAAIARAEVLNADVDAWRLGQPAALAPAAVKARARRATPGSVSALVTDYRASRWWLKLAPATRAAYEPCLAAIEAWAGDQPARSVTPPAVQTFYEAQLRRVEGKGRARQVIETPARAAASVRVLRLLMQVGVRLGYLSANPAAKPGISYTRAREPVLWSPDQVQHMAACADRLGWRSVATAILLNEWIGQREQDVLALPPWQVASENLVLRQGKTKRLVALPVHLVPHLVGRLQAEAARPGAVVSPAVLLLHDRTGQRWNVHTFRHVFADIRAAAVAGMPAIGELPALAPLPGCAGLRFMELRHTAVTRLHEAGVDEQGIAGITGHAPGSVRAMLDRHYIVRTAKAAEGAFRRRLAAEGGEV